MINRISHVGILVRDINLTLKKYEDILGLRPADVKNLSSSIIAFLPVGDDEMELIQPKNSHNWLGKILEERGEGVHHVALETDDIEATMKFMKDKGASMLDEKPRMGAHGVRIAFFTLDDEGIAFELIERR